MAAYKDEQRGTWYVSFHCYRMYIFELIKILIKIHKILNLILKYTIYSAYC